MTDQLAGKRWVCVGREVAGEPARFNGPYFYLTLESGDRFTKTSYENGKAVYDFTGTYNVENCHLSLSSIPRSVREGVMRRVEDYNISFSNDRYMTLTISTEGMATRTYYLVSAGDPGMNQFGKETKSKNDRRR